MLKTIALLAGLAVSINLVSAVASADRSAPAKCDKVLKMHGMLSRARFQCGYSKLSNELLAVAKTCADQLGERVAKENLAEGMKDFDYGESTRGHGKMCQEILHDFPQYVRK